MIYMEKLLAEGDYYDYGRVLSYHAPWIFVIGARGLGKTYGAKKLVIGDWIKKRWQFIYLRRTAEEQRKLLALKCHSVDQNITELSGGNQQKVLISKWLCCSPEVIIFDEPTRGIDVGAKAEIYKVMRQLADDGKVILMVSSELPEIIAVCDRIAVFCEGRLTQILTNRDDMSEEEIMAWALPQE